MCTGFEEVPFCARQLGWGSDGIRCRGVHFRFDGEGDGGVGRGVHGEKEDVSEDVSNEVEVIIGGFPPLALGSGVRLVNDMVRIVLFSVYEVGDK